MTVPPASAAPAPDEQGGPATHPAAEPTPPLVLASRSPQRRQILTTLGVPFRVRVAGVDEETEGDAVAVAVENARRKAWAVAAEEPVGTIVLGSDTVIAVPASGPGSATDLPGVPADPAARLRALAADGPLRAVGKPADAAAAAAMLRSWSGRAHHVVSSLAVVRVDAAGPTLIEAAADATRVRFRTLDAADVAWYVATDEWRERAGGYAIQLRGSLLVDGIDGDWWTVVGLPVGLLGRALPAIVRPSAPDPRGNARRA